MPNVNNFSFTIMTYTDQECEDLKKLCDDTVKYIVIGKEICPTTQRKHLQGFISFVERMSKQGVLNVFKNIIGRTDGVTVSVSKGNATSNSFYCRKEKDVLIEYGQVPMNDASKANESNKRKYTSIIEYAEQGNYKAIKQEYPSEYLRFHKVVHTLRKEFDLTRLKQPCGILYYGLGDTGKSYLAKDIDHYPKPKNKWWSDYRGQDRVVIDDVDPSFFSHYYCDLLNWIDIYPFPVETKGGDMLIRPKEIIMTSNYTIDQLLSGVPHVSQAPLRRKFTEIRLFEKIDDKYVNNIVFQKV